MIRCMHRCIIYINTPEKTLYLTPFSVLFWLHAYFSYQLDSIIQQLPVREFEGQQGIWRFHIHLCCCWCWSQGNGRLSTLFRIHRINRLGLIENSMIDRQESMLSTHSSQRKWTIFGSWLRYCQDSNVWTSNNRVNALVTLRIHLFLLIYSVHLVNDA